MIMLERTMRIGTEDEVARFVERDMMHLKLLLRSRDAALIEELIDRIGTFERNRDFLRPEVAFSWGQYFGFLESIAELAGREGGEVNG